MKKLAALFVAVVFASGTVGFAVAAEEKQPAEKKVEKPAEAKKVKAKTASGTVKSASADSVVVTGKEKGKEAEWTFAVDAKTTIKKAGKSITAADLQAGDSVHVKYAEQDGKTVAQSIMAKAAKKAKKSSQ